MCLSVLCSYVFGNGVNLDVCFRILTKQNANMFI